MASTPLFHAAPKIAVTNMVPGFSTRPRVVWTAGADGSEIRAINLASTDNASKNVQFSIGKKITTQAAMGVGTLVDNGASADQITRTQGSFITDGWLAGERLALIGATTLANGFEVLLTGVAALSVDLASGGGTVNTAEVMPAGSYLARLGRSWYVAVPAGSGVPSAVAVSGLDTTQAPFLDTSPDRHLLLGPEDILVAALSAALDTGETLDISVMGFDF